VSAEAAREDDCFICPQDVVEDTLSGHFGTVLAVNADYGFALVRLPLLGDQWIHLEALEPATAVRRTR
jgi:hypothetical protein